MVEVRRQRCHPSHPNPIGLWQATQIFDRHQIRPLAEGDFTPVSEPRSTRRVVGHQADGISQANASQLGYLYMLVCSEINPPM